MSFLGPDVPFFGSSDHQGIFSNHQGDQGDVVKCVAIKEQKMQRACANDSVRGPVRACSFKAPNFSSHGGAAAKVAPRLPPRLKLGAAAS